MTPGYNPAGWEPNAHERFSAPDPQIIKKYQELRQSYFKNQDKARRTWQEMMALRNAGQSAKTGHFLYEMMYDIYPGIEDKLMVGAIDTHLHIYPDYVPRSCDMIELAINASKAKMAAVVCKDHYFSNVGAAWGAQRFVEDMVRRGELESACKVFGTNILAWSFHPDQVHMIRKYPNLGAIFLPTFTGGEFVGPPLTILEKNGELNAELKECLHAAAEYNIPIMTGHRWTFEANYAIAKYIHDVGGRVLITHAGGEPWEATNGGQGGTVEQNKELAKVGAYLEVGGNKAIPNMMWPCTDPNVPFEFIKAVGPEHCIANTDFGQVVVQEPVDGFKLFVRMMIHYGFTEAEITTMIRTNPAKLLGLEV